MALLMNSTGSMCYNAIHATTEKLFLDKKKRIYYDDHNSILFYFIYYIWPQISKRTSWKGWHK